MQRLEVSAAVRHIYMSLRFRRLIGAEQKSVHSTPSRINALTIRLHKPPFGGRGGLWGKTVLCSGYLLLPKFTKLTYTGQWAGQRSWYSDCLRAGRSGDRIPVGERFSAAVQTGPEAHPSSCKMGTGSFTGVRCCRGVTLTPHPLLVQRFKMEQSYTSTLPKGFRGL